MIKCHRDVLAALVETRAELEPLLQRINFSEIAKHNYGYIRYAANPVEFFVDGEFTRFCQTVNYVYLNIPVGSAILDIGFFIPVVPIALAKLGYELSAVEKLSFYNGALDELLSLAQQKYNIQVMDFAITGDDTSFLHQKYDLVLLLAVLEHLNGTPKYLLKKLRNFLKSNGMMIIDVPNAVSLLKRLVLFFKGQYPYTSIQEYYFSDYPYSGHNREYSRQDLEFVLEQNGFWIKDLACFDHNEGMPSKGFKQKLIRVLNSIPINSLRPYIWAAVEPKHEVQAVPSKVAD
jgi:2-polyprenyl-3-methyl-5-hydroxy-6-metoxy-1,4-benzoquinol methylase